MFSLLVIDEDDKGRESLRARLIEHSDICEVVCAKNAVEVFGSGDFSVPDAVVLSAVMPLIDGLETVRRLRFEKRFDKTAIIMLSGIMLDHVVRQAMNNGADVCLWKPTGADTVYECVKRAVLRRNRAPESALDADRENVKNQSIVARLRDIGADETRDGFEYLLEGVRIACSFKHIYEIKLVSDVYEAIAVKHNTTVSRVERNMRGVIKYAWEKDPEQMSKILCVNRKPTVGDVIAKIAHMTRYWL